MFKLTKNADKHPSSSMFVLAITLFGRPVACSDRDYSSRHKMACFKVKANLYSVATQTAEQANEDSSELAA
jgi:hypothetical protein